MILSHSPASQILLRHKDFFREKHLLFSGDSQDTLSPLWQAKRVISHTTWYPHYQQLKEKLGERAEFSALPRPEFIRKVDTLIYFWPKSKKEAAFQLSYLCSALPSDIDIFIVGENRSGVRSSEMLLPKPNTMQKIDTARRCSLYHFQNCTIPQFNLDEWWEEYRLGNTLRIMSLPGVFSASHLDEGTKLLLDVLQRLPTPVSGDVLDMGSGAGVIGTFIGKNNADINLTLSDASASALLASKATLAANKVTGKIIASNIFSDITDKYDFILSNPPFHTGLYTSYGAAETLIREAKLHLKPGGYFCFVANRFLPYPEQLDAQFTHYQVVQQSSKFRVYLAQAQY